jgi:hypothetical protein
MQARLSLWSIPVLSLILVLGCSPRQTMAPSDTGTTLGLSSGTEPEPAGTPFSSEVYVLVSTEGDVFSVSPDPVVVHDRSQRVIWFAEDPDVAIEITFRPDKGLDTPRGAQPPGKPCANPARKCGQNPIGGNPGKFYYSVTGTKAGQPLPELDPVLDILP